LQEFGSCCCYQRNLAEGRRYLFEYWPLVMRQRFDGKGARPS
jgi:hypothetical protein